MSVGFLEVPKIPQHLAEPVQKRVQFAALTQTGVAARTPVRAARWRYIALCGLRLPRVRVRAAKR